jgi:[ribosomal protein S18]-alanine N-acetyltransferase
VSEPTIRHVSAADLTTVHRIEVDSYSDPWPRSIFFLMRGRAPDLFLVAEVDGGVIGYVIGEIEWREHARVGHVMNLAVVPDWRRRGLAGKLLDELERRFGERLAKSSYLEVRVGNIAAQSLYKKRGYAEVGNLPCYYRDEDGLAMEKPLS